MRKVLAVVLFACISAFAGLGAFPMGAHHLLPPGTSGTNVSPIPFGDDNGGSH